VNVQMATGRNTRVRAVLAARCKDMKRHARPDAGTSLLEVMIAGMVFTVGLLGGMALIVTAIANNNRSKMDSTATLIAQRTMERIASVPATATATSSPSSTVTIADCNPDSSLATHSVNGFDAGGGAGASLSGGSIDFSSSKITGYWMTYYACNTSTGDRQGSYDVRWYIKSLTANAKLVVVAAERLGTQTGHANNFARPVSLKMIVGL
jgi:Tfp pilus assembly protein PilV